MNDYVKAVADDYALDYPRLTFNIFDKLHPSLPVEDGEVIVYVRLDLAKQLAKNVYQIENIGNNVLTEQQYRMMKVLR